MKKIISFAWQLGYLAGSESSLSVLHFLELEKGDFLALWIIPRKAREVKKNMSSHQPQQQGSDDMTEEERQRMHEAYSEMGKKGGETRKQQMAQTGTYTSEGRSEEEEQGSGSKQTSAH
jgi:hypothetical protein